MRTIEPNFTPFDPQPYLEVEARAKRKKEQCSTCRFWLLDVRDAQPAYPEHGIGQCRRRAPRIISALVDRTLIPTPMAGKLSAASQFPIIDSGDWCGEFEWLPHLAPFEGSPC